ncbi:hypothetical protein F8144_38960 [Streptomyces triticiradicis]|uniref:Lipoyl-binding domain-containing protein n=1 Tax=Streptomyces triticiradicis TaxID=2651189 RepID=A0A7J5D4U1_9ACTN|nr:hypothetical protein F8144_38960 [Streptomyces triticiradicis]
MPALGETVSDGVVTRWLKSVGDVVKAGEPLLEVSTDKVDTEIEAPASGVLMKILVDEGETAKVGATLAIIGPPSPVPSPAQTNTNVTMPALGETVSDGVVTRWLKSVGDVVKAGEPLLEVSTDKVDTEIEAPASGVLMKILVDEGETAKVGATLAIIGPPNSAAKTN